MNILLYIFAAIGFLTVMTIFWIEISGDLADYINKKRHRSTQARIQRLQDKAKKWNLEKDSRYMDLFIDFAYEEKWFK